MVFLGVVSLDYIYSWQEIPTASHVSLYIFFKVLLRVLECSSSYFTEMKNTKLYLNAINIYHAL